jgi:hypothetical protein
MAMIKVLDWNDYLGPVPAGVYPVALSNSEQNDKGQLVFDFIVLEGQFKGRVIKKFCHTDSEMAIKMTSKTWVSICKAIGQDSEDTTKLHGKRLSIELEISEWEKDGNKKVGNNIKAYLPLAPLVATTGAPPFVAETQKQSADDLINQPMTTVSTGSQSTPPWAK